MADINVDLSQVTSSADGKYYEAFPAGDAIQQAVADYFASQNTAANSGSAIWASSLVTDGNGSGTFADPYSLRGAIYSAGLGAEVVLKDDGVYQLTNPLNLASDFDDTTYPDTFNGGSTGGTAWGGGNPKVVTMNTAKPTQESERITIRGEQGTCPVIDCQQMRFMSLEANQFMTFRSLSFINTREVFFVYAGSNSCEWDLTSYVMTQGGDNYSPIIASTGSENGVITRYYAEGPGLASEGVHANTAGFFIRHNNNWSVTHATIHNFPLGIYYKHPNDPADVGGVANVAGIFENVHVYNTDRDGGNNISANGYTFRNCLLNGAQFGATGGTGANGIAEGGSDCEFDHVTILNDLVFDGAALSTGGSNNPSINDSLVGGVLKGQPTSGATNFNATANYNLYGNDSFVINNTTLTFAQWKTQESVDANSIQATPSFVGSSENTPSDYALVASTSGTGAASDAADMGCDVIKVGYNGAA